MAKQINISCMETTENQVPETVNAGNMLTTSE